MTGKFAKFGYSFPCKPFYVRSVMLGIGHDPTIRDVWYLVNTNRREDKQYTELCIQMTDQLQIFMWQILGPRYGKSHVVTSASVSEDMLRISEAHLFIGSISSFSLWGAIANGRNSALPRSKFFFGGNHAPVHGISWIDPGGVLMPEYFNETNHVKLEEVGDCN